MVGKKVLRIGKNKTLDIIEENVSSHKQNKDSQKKQNQAYSLISQLGLSITLPIVGGALLGNVIDQKFGTSPKVTLSLIFLGLFIGIVNMYTTIRDID